MLSIPSSLVTKKCTGRWRQEARSGARGECRRPPRLCSEMMHLQHEKAGVLYTPACPKPKRGGDRRGHPFLVLLRRSGWFAGGLLSLGFKFLHRCFATEAYLARTLVDSDALHGDRIAHLNDVFRATDAEIGEFTDVDEAFLARRAFDECAEVFHSRDAAGVDLTDFDGSAAATAAFAATTSPTKAIDLFDRAVHRFRVVGIDENLAGIVFGDVDLRAGRFGDTTDRLAARSDEETDLLGIDLDRLDARSVLTEIGTGSWE